ncbi:septum site-determining protein MinC [Niveispirillum sp. BGYR6]|uniref:septum site-determining protein MinC n=1 Tax=Niveispirillum sp. BGYR6 TaxID=2971249 RepID=UPI0022B99FF9|nr:septum site-determining protein MinC [Niveispirillum sp. BGYR6]MDG5495500.1 septum site-determining protein MinC [Niveispirillum sp. BGYR6]
MSTQVAYRDAPFQLRGSTFTMMVLKVSDPRNPNFFPVLSGKIAQAPNFFRHAPVVLDLDDLPAGVPFDFESFIKLLRNLGLIAVGLQGGTKEQQDAALAVGLALLQAPRGKVEMFDPLAGTGRSPAQGLANVQAQAQPPAHAPAPAAPVMPEPPPPPRASMLVTEPIRSGRQIYAAGCDLIVVGPVSPGAELLADGSIHVYGTLRGRALAGVSGDQNARIFCQSLEAELVSIAGLYRVSEDMDKDIRRRQVQIYLNNGFLHIDPVSA